MGELRKNLVIFDYFLYFNQSSTDTMFFKSQITMHLLSSRSVLEIDPKADRKIAIFRSDLETLLRADIRSWIETEDLRSLV